LKEINQADLIIGIEALIGGIAVGALTLVLIRRRKARNRLRR